MAFSVYSQGHLLCPNKSFIVTYEIHLQQFEFWIQLLELNFVLQLSDTCHGAH